MKRIFYEIKVFLSFKFISNLRYLYTEIRKEKNKFLLCFTFQVDSDKLKQRAERFGVVSPVLSKVK